MLIQPIFVSIFKNVSTTETQPQYPDILHRNLCNKLICNRSVVSTEIPIKQNLFIDNVSNPSWHYGEWTLQSLFTGEMHSPHHSAFRLSPAVLYISLFQVEQSCNENHTIIPCENRSKTLSIHFHRTVKFNVIGF